MTHKMHERYGIGTWVSLLLETDYRVLIIMMLKATLNCINFLDGNLHRFSFDNGNYEISNLKVGQL